MNCRKPQNVLDTSVVIVGALVLLFPACQLTAQIDVGGITGTVEDKSGAIVSTAHVSLTNEGTGVRTTTLSTSTGAYVFDALRPGLYTLEATAAGFGTTVNRSIVVHVQQILTVDFALIPGSVSQQATVTATPYLLQAQNGSLGQTVGTTMVNDLPLDGRDWVSLAQLSAGVVTAAPQASTNAGQTGSAYFAVNGVSLWQNDIRLNGTNDNIEIYGGSKIGTNATIVPPPDAIQEFRLQSGDLSAEFGYSTGAVVDAVTKSGANRLNGDLWEYLRNNDFQSNDYFSKQNGTAIAPYHQNQFGGTLGGPLSLPGVYDGRNKTFFFLAYQGLRNVQALNIYSPSTSLLSTVPTLKMQQSGFTNLQDLINDLSGSTTTDALGRTFPLGTIMDPATTRSVVGGAVDPVTGLNNSSSTAVYVRDPFYAGASIERITNFTTSAAEANLNLLPRNRLDPNAIKMLQLYPQPTAQGFLNNFYNNPQVTNIENQGDVRFDQNLSASDNGFLAADYSHIVFNIPSVLPGLAVGQTFGQAQSFPAYMIAVGYNHTFSPALMNEFHFGVDHFIENVKSIYGDSLGIPAEFGIDGIPQLTNNGGLPPTTIAGMHNIGVASSTPTLETMNVRELSDNLTQFRGKHTFKTGFQLDSLSIDITQPPNSRGNFTYTGQYTDVVNKSRGYNGVADLLLTPIAATVANGINNVGGLSAYSGSNYSSTSDHRWYAAAYFQDDWKVTHRLTFNIGLRWDYFTPYAEIQGRQANLALAGGNGSTGTYYMPSKGCAIPKAAAFDSLLASSNIHLDCVPNLAVGEAQTNNFAPRVGFAYRLLPNTVVRGGYGVAYGALGNIGYAGTLGQNYPFLYNITNLSNNNSYTPITLANGVTATEFNTFGTINISDSTQITGVGISLYGRQYKFQTPYIQTSNLMIQDLVTPHDSLTAGYVGTVGRHLDNYSNALNAPSVILPPGTRVSNYIPLPAFAANTAYETTNATSSYNSLQATYEHQFSGGLTLLSNWTLSKCMSNQRSQATTLPNYRAPWLAGFGIGGDYSLCDFDATNSVHISGSYELPVGQGRMYANHIGRAGNAVLGGWSVNVIYTYQRGQPLTIPCATSTSADFGCNANVVAGQNIYGGLHNQHQWLNPAAFATPPVATSIGQASVAPLGPTPEQARGPGFSNLDSSILKNFRVSDSVYLQFRVEAFNTFNNPQFGQPTQLNYTSSNFGQITSLRNGPRLFQLAIKLFF